MAGPRITLSAQDMPIEALARDLADRYGVSMVVSSKIDGARVNAELRDVAIEEAVAVVARRLGVEATRAGDVWLLGELRAEDRGVLVRRVVRLDKDGLNLSVKSLLSEFGRLATFEDGVLVVGDRVDVLERVGRMLDQVEALEAESWVVQLHIVATFDQSGHALGFAGMPTFDIAATATATSVAPDFVEAWEATAAWSSLVDMTWNSGEVAVLASPVLLLESGRTASISDGQELRLPTNTVSDEGTVTTTGFQVIDAGLTTSVGLQDLGSERARIEVELVVSEITGSTAGDVPIITRQRLEVSPVVRSGGIYLLGALERSRATENSEAPWRSSSTREWRRLHVWGRVQRIRPVEPVEAEDR